MDFFSQTGTKIRDPKEKNIERNLKKNEKDLWVRRMNQELCGSQKLQRKSEQQESNIWNTWKNGETKNTDANDGLMKR